MLSKILILALAIPVFANAAEKSPPLVFIHGIKGSVLVDERGDTRWLTGGQALGFGDSSLALPLEWKDGVQTRDTLRAKSVLEKVSVIPFFFENPVYGPWLKAANWFGRPFRVFPYDWRRDNLETLALFEKFMEAMGKEYGEKPQVVAHSMGGLLTLALLHERPELFHSVVFVGTPFEGGVGFLPDLHIGDKVGMNKRLLSYEVMSSFPAAYVFFPFETKALRAKDGSPLDVDFYSVEDWKKHAFSFFADRTADTAVYEAFLETTLKRNKTFREKLRPRSMTYPPITVVSSKSVPTLSCLIKEGPKSKRGWDFESCPKEEGDGRVTAKSALPPNPIPYKSFESKAEHAALLNDPLVIDLIRKSP